LRNGQDRPELKDLENAPQYLLYLEVICTLTAHKEITFSSHQVTLRASGLILGRLGKKFDTRLVQRDCILSMTTNESIRFT
jgi:hypothetical protein